MAFEILQAPADPQVMFHGTSSAHLASILANGLMANPARRLTTMDGRVEDAHLIAFEGVYLSLDPDRARHYALGAAKSFGGDPLMVTAQVVPDMALPDEDEMLWVLKCRFDMASEEREWEPGYAGLFRDPAFRASYAKDLQREIVESLDPDAVDRDSMEAHLVRLLEGVALLPAKWEGVTGNKGWLVQPWAMAMARTPEGMTRYREALDGLCRSVLGPRPTEETCGWDGYKLRMPEGVPLEGPSFIAALGTIDDPRLHLDRLDEMQAETNPFAGDFLGTGAPAPR